jgi:DNA-binding NarL/FixJ family response regulator
VIDVGQAFAPGQVYVALSRLRSLEGLILRSRIQSDLIFSDHQVVNFSQGKNQSRLDELLQQHQNQYLTKLLLSSFDLKSILQEIDFFRRNQESSMEFEDQEMMVAIPEVAQLLIEERENTERFGRQLIQLLQTQQVEKLMERIEKGGQYYRELLSRSLKRILIHRGMVEQFSQTKKYLEGLDTIEESILKKYLEISKVGRLIKAILSGQIPGKMDDLESQVRGLRLQFIDIARENAVEKIKKIKTKTGRKKTGEAKPKRKKGDTHELTYELHLGGKSIPEMAKERGLAESTIKSHLAQGIETGRIELEDCLPEIVILEIKSQLENFQDMATLRTHFEGKYDYGTIKMVIAGNKIS